MKDNNYEKNVRYGVAVNAAIQETIQQQVAPTQKSFQKKVDEWHQRIIAVWEEFELKQEGDAQAKQAELEKKSEAILEDLGL